MQKKEEDLLNSWLEVYDAVKIINTIVKIINDYEQANGIFKNIKRWYIKNIRYQLMFKKWYLKNHVSNTINLVFKYPKYMVLIISRYLSFLSIYCDLFHINYKSLINKVLPGNQLDLEIETNKTNTTFELLRFNLIIRNNIPIFDKNNKIMIERYAILNLECDYKTRDYTISQKCYNTNNKEYSRISNIIYEKTFFLNRNGELSNPNYILDKNLEKEDLFYYKIMIGQLCLTMWNLIAGSTNLLFIKK